MSYSLGVDVGTTSTSAAVWRDGTASVVPLRGDAATIPSVVCLVDDPDGGTALLVGAAADERGATEPERVARSFRDAIGDPVPRLLGDEEVPATELVSALIEYVVATVSARLGQPPGHVTLTCPASWGPHERTALTRAAQQAGLADVGLVTEPVAAAVHHAAQGGAPGAGRGGVDGALPVGAHLLVYDLGGSDLAVSVVTRTDTGYAETGPSGHAPGVGGEAFDEAVMAHVRGAVSQALRQLDPDEPEVLAGLWAVRRKAVAAKELLSTETEAEVAVDLPGLSRRVRYTRSELEAAVRPLVLDSVEVARRTAERAGVAPDELAAVLLTGGSSAMPLVGMLVGSGVGAPVVVDPRPKLAVCLGAAVVGAARVAEPEPQPPAGRAPLTSADSEASALAVDVPDSIAVDPPGIGVAAPLDVPLPTRPDPARPRRRVVSEVFEYAPPRAATLGRVLVVLAALAAAAAVAGLALVLASRGGSPGGATTPVPDPAAGSPQPPDAPTVLTPGTPVAVAGPEAQAAGLAALPDGGLLVAGRDVASGLPRVWRRPADASEFGPATAPPVGAGRRGAVEDVAVAGEVVVAVGWTASEDADPLDRSARSARAWLTDTSLSQPWQAVDVPGVAELTSVDADGSGLVGAGVGFDVDAAEGDGVVLRSVDGRGWAPVPGLALAGPGPARVVALAASGGALVAAVERRDGAAARTVLLESDPSATPEDATWVEAARLDGPGTAVAAAGGLDLLPDSQVLAVGGDSGVAGDRALVWTVSADVDAGAAPEPLAVEGFAALAGVVLSGGEVLAVGPQPGAGPAVATLPLAVGGGSAEP